MAAVAIAAAIGDLIIFPLQWYRAPIIPPGYAVLSGVPRGALAEFPFYGERIAFPLHAQYMLFSTSHWLPMVNGYSDVIPVDFREAASFSVAFRRTTRSLRSRSDASATSPCTGTCMPDVTLKSALGWNRFCRTSSY